MKLAIVLLVALLTITVVNTVIRFPLYLKHTAMP